MKTTYNTIKASLAILAATVGSSNAALVALYQFENNFNDTGDAPANNGSAVGGAGFSTMTPPNNGGNNSLSLNGTTQYVTVPDENSLDITGNLTLAAWIRPTSFVNDQAGIIAKYQNGLSGNNRSYGLRLSNANGGADVTTNNLSFLISGTGAAGAGAFTAASNIELALDTWTHVAATYSTDGTTGTSRIYINGVLDSAATTTSTTITSINASAAPLWIGAQFADNQANRFAGQIDDARVYNNALSGSEIAALVPEPSTALLGALGLLGLLRRRR